MQVAKCTIVCLLILYFGNRIIHYKDRFSPTRIFNLWWTVCIGMSLYPVWGRNVASNEIYLTLLVAVICFNFGAFCGRKSMFSENLRELVIVMFRIVKAV